MIFFTNNVKKKKKKIVCVCVFFFFLGEGARSRVSEFSL